MGQPFIDQDSFAWLQDDADLEANTAIGSTNDQLTSPTLDSNYRLRFLLQNTGDKDDEEKTLSVRTRWGENIQGMTLEAFLERIQQDTETRKVETG